MTVKRRRTGRKQNNRGVTLVELLVAVAILSIVLGTALGFLTHAMGAFNRGISESNLQNEAQLTMARLQSMIVNANLGIRVTNSNEDPGDKVNPDSDGNLMLEKSGSSGSNLYIYNLVYSGGNVTGYEVEHIYAAENPISGGGGTGGSESETTGGSESENAGKSAVKDVVKLWYSKYRYTLNNDDPETLVDNQLLAEYIKVNSFQAVLTQSQKNCSVEIIVNFKDRDKTYEAKNTFFPRNKF